MSESEANQTNVYETPKADLKIESEENEFGLAERKDRFFAVLIDSLIGVVVGIPFVFFAGPYLGFEGFDSQAGYKYLVPAVIYGFVMFVLIHGYLLSRNGQTIGKRALKIKIVSVEGQNVSLLKLLLLRYFPFTIITLVPLIGNFLPVVDALFIFRKDKRCVHDLIAGTKVIKYKV